MKVRVLFNGNAEQVSRWLINLREPFVIMTQYDHRALPGFNFMQVTILSDNGGYREITAYEGDTIIHEDGDLKIESAT